MRLLLLFLVITSWACSPSAYNRSGRAGVHNELVKYHLDQIDTLVDIGCGYAVYDVEIAHYYPDMYLILEDLPENPDNKKRDIFISSVLHNTSYTPKIKSHYRFVTGTPDSIPLETGRYKTILCRLTAHEFSNSSKMVKELYRILSKEGTLIVADVEPLFNGEKDKTCNHNYLSKKDLIDMFSLFKLKDETFEESQNRRINILMLGK